MIVKVAVEFENVIDMDVFVEGLWLLNRVDVFVEVSVMDMGEYVVVVVGEVYFE